MEYLGEIFALITALGWALSSLFFEHASKRADSVSVNVIRLILGIIFLGSFTLIDRGIFLPMDSTLHNWKWLGLSGLVGLFFGDLFLYEAYKLIGARICMLFMTMTPLVVGVFGYLFLGETLSLLQILAMVITCSGVLLVVIKPKNRDEKKLSPKGVLFICIGTVLEAVGIVLTKMGSMGYDASSSTQIRMICALGVFTIFLTYKKLWGKIWSVAKDRKSLLLIAGGTITATSGITFLVAALNLGHAGIISTISSTSPILIIPISFVVFKERIKLKEIVGACISVFGIALFFL